MSQHPLPTDRKTDRGQPARHELDAVLGFLDQRKLEDAERAARALVLSYPISAVANFALARVLADKRDDRNAINHARQAVQIEPGNVEYLTFLGVIYNRMGVYELAGPILKKSWNSHRHHLPATGAWQIITWPPPTG